MSRKPPTLVAPANRSLTDNNQTRRTHQTKARHRNSRARRLQRRPEESRETLRAKVRDGRVGDEEPARAGRDRRAGRRVGRDSGHDQ